MSLEVELMRVDEACRDVIKFTHGKHVLGRGPSLKCNETKLSRSHAVLNVSDETGEVAITPIHVNPCFYRRDDEDFITLKKDESKVLKSGDTISLLPSKWTYTIVIKENSDTKITEKQNEASNQSTINAGRKRKLPIWLQHLATQDTSDDRDFLAESKKPNKSRKKASNGPNAARVKNKRQEEDEETKSENEGTSKQSANSQGNSRKAEKTQRNLEESDEMKSDNENESVNTQILNSQGSSQSAKEKQKNSQKTTNSQNESESDNTQKINTQNTNSQSKQKPCPYGSKCYRKNPQHFVEFSHNDSDKEDEEMESDEDDRPECEYGLDCYRKNPQHLRDFKHVKRKRDAAKKARATTKMLNDDDDDSNDSFIVDDDDDAADPEYSASDTDPDDEYTDLMAEAKSFAKGNKK